MSSSLHWEDYFYYDPSSPSGLRWAKDAMRGRNYASFARRRGEVAGTCKGVTGRWQLIVDKKHYLVHRVIYELIVGDIPEGMMIDHLDGDYRNNAIENLRVVTRSVNARNAKKNDTNKSGVAGVHLTTNYDKHGAPYYYWTASWRGVDLKQISKHFAISNLGYDEAFRLACEHRANMIAELNEQGAGYTERHGTLDSSITPQYNS